MYIPYLHLLDRNAVSLIKESNAGKAQTDRKKIAFLQRLRRLDRQQDYVSPLLSIMEGERGQEDTAEEKAACQRKESEAIRRFFKAAHTDSDLLDACSDVTGRVFSGHRESGWDAREAFLSDAASLIADPVRKDQRQRVESHLVALAAKTELSPNDPLVVLCLACLHGSEDARSVIKPRKLDAYNVLSDLHVLSRVGAVRAVAQQYPARLRVRFVSMDKGLVGVLAQIGLVSGLLSADGDLQLDLAYRHGLFPGLTEAAYVALLRTITSEPT